MLEFAHALEGNIAIFVGKGAKIEDIGAINPTVDQGSFLIMNMVQIGTGGFLTFTVLSIVFLLLSPP